VVECRNIFYCVCELIESQNKTINQILWSRKNGIRTNFNQK